MTLPHARDARALFVVAITIIMVVLLSRSVVQESHAISGTLKCIKMPSCTTEKCQQLCVSQGHVNGRAYDYYCAPGVPECCCVDIQ
ncbi:hypothetical protein PVAP13_2NG530303 [Panicum virgatum]|uniref:Uncharacterized protein n=1 Tax=Panicum virgatum TaxID=38727 RepID=A0A8T0VWQ2_PANVG|nr:hypothetical protein PVAP13_2NG530303 [Panicum virgatum]